MRAFLSWATALVVVSLSSTSALAETAAAAREHAARADDVWRTALEPLEEGDVVVGLGADVGGSLRQYMPAPPGVGPFQSIVLEPRLFLQWGVTDWLTLRLFDVELIMLRGGDVVPTLSLAAGIDQIVLGYSNAGGSLAVVGGHVVGKSVWRRGDLMAATTLSLAARGAGFAEDVAGPLAPSGWVSSTVAGALRLSATSSMLVALGAEARVLPGTLASNHARVWAELPTLRAYLGLGLGFSFGPRFGVALGRRTRDTFVLVDLDVFWMPRRR